jgi:hypothetical protein
MDMRDYFSILPTPFLYLIQTLTMIIDAFASGSGNKVETGPSEWLEGRSCFQMTGSR